MSFLKNLIYGLIIGVANIIPGVSGGTMAVVLNIYDKLIDSVAGLRRKLRENLIFLIPIGLGAELGILLFSKLIKWLLGSFPMPTNFFFLGLILGSVPMIYRRAKREALKPSSLLPFAAAVAIMLAITALSEGEVAATVVTALTPIYAARLVICSAVAAACMILPGISGSMVMVLLGVYTSVLTAISDLNIIFLIPVVFGVMIGILGGAKLISLCLEKFEQGTYFAILGLILASLLPVFLQAGFSPGWQTLAAAITLAAGIFVALMMTKLEKRLKSR